MNGRRKRILTSLGSLSFATLPEGESKRAEIAFKRQLDKAKPEGESKEPVKNGTASLKNGTAPHHLALQGASPLSGSLEAADNFAEKK